MPDELRTTLGIKAVIRYADFDLDIDEQFDIDGVVGLFGPSGGGKSTMLRIIAGFEPAAHGQVWFADEQWQTDNSFVPPHQRPVGYAFQDARLFSHLSVEGNLRFADDRASRGRIQYDDVLSALDLTALLPRNVDGLSGGEKQRVSIARTLLSRPRLLLLDEPLAALDAARKSDILPYLQKLSRHFGIPTIYVSHSVAEISQLADRVIVLDRGRVQSSGSTVEVLNQLELQSAMSAFESMTILEASIANHITDAGLTELDCYGQTIVVPLLAHLKAGESVRLHIRAGDVALATEKPKRISFRNVLSGIVSAVENDPESPFAGVSIDIGGSELRAQLTRHAIADLELDAGTPVFALLKTSSFDRRE